ncbi:hypothetical protein NEPAR06_2139 [Nematocida parisii]|nr:hypothetical protein NEPAR08_1070 [Nematocida parisii]KAI5128398.1 hypothetical protein NEPAR03_1307 [Nematocida parisii]KAI5141674.1 hypothetical protein NEPAR04_1146 [Nematocida parisii]KAI5146096.1 hypothetical protein NEPAR07_2106 [Nematocida parisii]KAI5156242.1 hypothetical protein NEPAR06_2139 [Nematocida parisii]
MTYEYNPKLYKEYTEIIESVGVDIPSELEETYKKYIEEQMKAFPYVDESVLRMYSLVFFLKYVKQSQGPAKFRSVYSKLEMQKRLISRAMESVTIDFDKPQADFNVIEDWSSLYSIHKKGIKNFFMSQNQTPTN